jgi:hypothetical protein
MLWQANSLFSTGYCPQERACRKKTGDSWGQRKVGELDLQVAAGKSLVLPKFLPT